MNTIHFDGVLTADEELHRSVENIDPKIIRYTRLRRTTENLAAAKNCATRPFISPMMRDSTWNGREWVRSLAHTHPAC